MRVLFKKHTDFTLFCEKVRNVFYDPETMRLHFKTEDCDEIIIPHIQHPKSVEIIRSLFATGKLDLSSQLAYINEVPPVHIGTRRPS